MNEWKPQKKIWLQISKLITIQDNSFCLVFYVITNAKCAWRSNFHVKIVLVPIYITEERFLANRDSNVNKIRKYFSFASINWSINLLLWTKYSSYKFSKSIGSRSWCRFLLLEIIYWFVDQTYAFWKSLIHGDAWLVGTAGLAAAGGGVGHCQRSTQRSGCGIIAMCRPSVDRTPAIPAVTMIESSTYNHSKSFHWWRNEPDKVNSKTFLRFRGQCNRMQCKHVTFVFAGEWL